MNFPKIKLPDSHFISVAQMIETDRLMIEEYHIELIQMMENAGRNLALLTCKVFPNINKVTILAGSGGNGGGVLVCARHLHNWGFRVQLALSRPEPDFSGVPAHQFEANGHSSRVDADTGQGYEPVIAGNNFLNPFRVSFFYFILFNQGFALRSVIFPPSGKKLFF